VGRPPLPWVRPQKGPQPRRGCVVQPRVAVCGYPGKRPQEGANPEGVASAVPGLPSAATLGDVMKKMFNPSVGCPKMICSNLVATPKGCEHFVPRVAADGNPGMADATPLGLGTLLRPYPG